MLLDIQTTAVLCHTCRMVVELDLLTWMPYVKWDVHETYYSLHKDMDTKKCARCEREVNG